MLMIFAYHENFSPDTFHAENAAFLSPRLLQVHAYNFNTTNFFQASLNMPRFNTTF